MKDLCPKKMQSQPGNTSVLPKPGMGKSRISYPFLTISSTPSKAVPVVCWVLSCVYYGKAGLSDPPTLHSSSSYSNSPFLQWEAQAASAGWLGSMRSHATWACEATWVCKTKQASKTPKLKTKIATQTKSFCSSTLGRCLSGYRLQVVLTHPTPEMAEQPPYLAHCYGAAGLPTASSTPTSQQARGGLKAEHSQTPEPHVKRRKASPGTGSSSPFTGSAWNKTLLWPECCCSLPSFLPWTARDIPEQGGGLHLLNKLLSRLSRGSWGTGSHPDSDKEFPWPSSVEW